MLANSETQTAALSDEERRMDSRHPRFPGEVWPRTGRSSAQVELLNVVAVADEGENRPIGEKAIAVRVKGRANPEGGPEPQSPSSSAGRTFMVRRETACSVAGGYGSNIQNKKAAIKPPNTSPIIGLVQAERPVVFMMDALGDCIRP